LPIGVRAVETMTASCIAFSFNLDGLVC
jgi:hypothetical protein